MQIEAFRAVFPNLEFVTNSDSFFSSVKEEYPEYLESGFFSKSEQTGIYIYQIRATDRTHTGIIARSNIEDFIEGDDKKVFGHEDIIPAKEQRQIELLLKRKAIVKPILLTYPPQDEITALQEEIINQKKPDFEIVFDKEKSHHLIWSVKDQRLIELFQEQFNKIDRTYISDGHHRSSSSRRLFQRAKDKDFREKHRAIMTAFFDTEQIEILDFNRVIAIKGHFSSTLLIAKLSKVCDIEILPKAEKPTQKFELTLFLDEEYYRLRWKSSILERYKDQSVVLDCALLDDLILKDLFEVEDISTNPDIFYVEGPKGTKGIIDKMKKNAPAVGFCLYPVSTEEMVKIANQNKFLPPKSTWFVPRMKNGIIVYEF